MQTEQPTFRLDDARAPLWFGGDAGWGHAVRTVTPSMAQSAEAMVAAAGLSWTVEQHPIEGGGGRDNDTRSVPVPKHVANIRSDNSTVVGVVGEGYEPLQNRTA